MNRQARRRRRSRVATPDRYGVIRIGRDYDNDVVILNAWVPGKHAEMLRDGSGFVLLDLPALVAMAAKLRPGREKLTTDVESELVTGFITDADA